ncbi:transglycosylase domain-containing protein [Euzebya sp.]|uniref:transglycosylase domain-containing protein n=1 Tax=Euzebya sp. TaxID=1971409 RepID=UPI00351801E0
MASPSLPARQPKELHVLVRLLLAVIGVPLLIIGAGTAFGAGIVPAVGPVAEFTHRVDSEVLNFPPLGDIIEGYRADERSVVLDSQGGELAILRAVNRVNVEIEDIPLHVQNAVLATEDQEFRNHRGVNWQAIARAAAGNIRAGDIESGASTITQQLIKNLTGNAETTIERKLQEAVYAIELERTATKDEILEIYMNEAYLANGVYGFGTAAEYYFSKDITDLTVGEAAMLAGMLRAPNANDPLNNPRNALDRRNIVVQQMVDADFITAAEAAEILVDAPDTASDDQVRDLLGLRINAIESPDEPFFVSYIRTLLRDIPELGVDAEARENFVLRGGLTIETTVNPDMQDIAQDAITDVLSDPDGPQSALTSIDPRTGEILAIGFGPKEFGSGPGQTEVLPAVPGVGSSFGRQPGSSFKAFEIVAALEAGVTPAYTVDTPSPYTPRGACANSGWRPGNYSDGSGGTMNMVRATAVSSNVYFAHLVDEFTGPEGLADTATRMGIVNTDLFNPPGPAESPVCSTVLGATEVYPLDMASGFGTMANGGILCEPYAITRILNADGEVIYEGGGDCHQAIQPDHAAAATSLLRGPIENGTASRNGQIGRPAAGKTGTTQDWRDAWFVGYIPQMSTAVWVGNETPSTMVDNRCGRVTGGCLPTMIWRNFMTAAIEYRQLEVADFPPPPRLPSDTVPSVVGMTEEQATATLAEAEYSAESVSVPDYRPAGTVVAQSPAGGSEAPKGTLVVLDVSDGTGEPPEVPDVIGLSAEEAQQIIQNDGLDVTVVEVPVDDPDSYGVVISASFDPETGTVTLEVGRERTPDDPTPTASPSPSDEPDDDGTPDPAESPTPGAPTAPPDDGDPTEEPPDDDDGPGPGQGPPPTPAAGEPPEPQQRPDG